MYCSFMKEEMFSFSVLTHENILDLEKKKKKLCPFTTVDDELTFQAWLSLYLGVFCFVLFF